MMDVATRTGARKLFLLAFTGSLFNLHVILNRAEDNIEQLWLIAVEDPGPKEILSRELREACLIGCLTVYIAHYPNRTVGLDANNAACLY